MTQREGRALKLENYLPLSKKANFFPLPSFTKITKFHDFPLLLVFPIQNRRAAKNPLKYIRQMKSIRSIRNKCISFCETMKMQIFSIFLRKSMQSKILLCTLFFPKKNNISCNWIPSRVLVWSPKIRTTWLYGVMGRQKVFRKQ